MSLSPNLIRIGAPLRSSLIVDYIDRIVIGTKVALNISSKQSINVDFVGLEYNFYFYIFIKFLEVFDL